MNYEKRHVNIKGWEMYQVDTNGNVYSKQCKLDMAAQFNGKTTGLYPVATDNWLIRVRIPTPLPRVWLSLLIYKIT